MSMVMSNHFRRPPDRPDPNSDYEAGGKPLNGIKVLAIFVGCFLFVFAVNGVMIYNAMKTFSGEVAPHAYERGLAYNRDIAQAREQAMRDWKVDARLSKLPGGETEIEITALDAAGDRITGAEMSAVLAAPADLRRDVRLKLDETTPGRYAGKAIVPPGQRDLVLTAARGGQEVFRSKNRVDIQ